MRGEFDFEVPEQAGELVGGYGIAILVAGVGLTLAGKLRLTRAVVKDVAETEEKDRP